MTDDPATKALRCRNCRFWLSLEPTEVPRYPGDTSVDYVRGACRRYPPLPFSYSQRWAQGSESQGIWPATQAKDWCGDFYPKSDGVSPT